MAAFIVYVLNPLSWGWGGGTTFWLERAGKFVPVHHFHPAFIAFPSVIMLSHMAPSSVIMLSILATSPTGMAFMAGPRAHTVQRAPEARMAVLEPGSKVLVTGKGPVMLLAAKLAAVQVLHLGIPASP